MAGIQLGSVDICVSNSRRATADHGGTDVDLATPLNYTSHDAMRTRLAAISGTYYTTARLDQLSTNDMVYALRMHDDATSVASYLSNTTP